MRISKDLNRIDLQIFSLTKKNMYQNLWDTIVLMGVPMEVNVTRVLKVQYIISTLRAIRRISVPSKRETIFTEFKKFKLFYILEEDIK